MLKPPCGKHCEDRQVGCHSKCEKYQAYADIVAMARERRRQFQENQEQLYGMRRPKRR